MPVHEKIRFIRQAKGLTQEDVANKLEMSVNGYGDIERGETDVNLSRLEQLASLFEIKLSELFGLDEKNVFNVTGSNNAGIGHQQNCTITSCPADYLQLQKTTATERHKRQRNRVIKGSYHVDEKGNHLASCQPC
jgi:transcriptional regulator with XRE-family HTH domain